MDPGIGRAAVKGAVVGFVVVLTYYGSIALAADAGLISALGVGAFAAHPLPAPDVGSGGVPSGAYRPSR